MAKAGAPVQAGIHGGHLERGTLRHVPSLLLEGIDSHPNGDCVYLGADGCTIHGRQPAVCKAFDCRVFFRKLYGLPMEKRDHLIANKPRVKETAEIGARMLAKYPLR